MKVRKCGRSSGVTGQIFRFNETAPMKVRKLRDGDTPGGAFELQ